MHHDCICQNFRYQDLTKSQTETKNKQDHKLIYENKKIEIQSTSAIIDNLKQQNDANEARKPIAKNQSIINSKLIDARIRLIQNVAIESLRTLTEQKQDTGNKNLAGLNEEVETINVSLGKLTKENKKDEAAISVIPIEDIKASENSLQHQINEMAPATACWKILYTNQQEVLLIEQKLKVNQVEIQNKKANQQLKILNWVRRMNYKSLP